MKKILLLTVVFSFAFSDVTLSVCGHTDDGAGNVAFDICYITSDVIAGVQFTFDGGQSGYTQTGIAGGAMENTYTAGGLMSNAGGLVLGFSFSGATLPTSEATENLPNGSHLITVTGTYDSNGITTVGPILNATDAFADPTPSNLTVTTEQSSWEAGNDSGLLDAGTTPAEYSLKAAYPNPFNPTTTIEYNVLEPGNVSIVVYDMTGREVKTLVNDFVSPSAAGNYSVVWDGTNNGNAFVATGIYIYRMIANDFVKTQKMTLTK